jgi:transposase
MKKKQSRRSNPPSNKVLEKRRRRAIDLLAKHISLREVARRLDCNASSVMRWRNRHATLGEAGLKVGKSPGRRPRHSLRQKKGLMQRLLNGPGAYGWKTDVWTTLRIAELIRRRYGVRYRPDHIGRVLHQLGWIIQKPERRAMERNKVAITGWTEMVWEGVKKT